jgi:hypothetical protein
MPVANGRTRLLLELAVYALLSVIDGDYVSRYILSLRKS